MAFLIIVFLAVAIVFPAVGGMFAKHLKVEK
jgi:hypothetical protein